MIDLLDAAMIHDGNPIRGHHGFGLVMRHVNGGHPKFVVQSPDFKTHLLPQCRIQVGQRLVKQQHGGPDNNRAGQRHPLLLTAAEFGRVTVRKVVHMYDFQHFADAAFYFGLRHPAQLQSERDVLLNRHVWPDGVALKDHRHLTPVRRHRAGRRGENLTVHLDDAGGRVDEAGDHPQGRGLAATGRPEQRDEFAGLQFEIDAVDREKIAVAFADAA